MVTGRNNSRANLTLFPIFVIGMIVFLIIRDVGFVSYSKWYLVAFCVFFFVLFPYEDLVYATFFLMPLLCGIPSTYVLSAMALLLLIRAGSIKKTAIGILAFFIILEFLSTLWVSSVSYISIVKYIAHFAVFFQLLNGMENNSIEYEKCILLYMVGTVVLCAVIISRTFLSAPSDWLWRFSKGWFRFGMDVSETSGEMVLQLNANSLAYYSITGIACGLAEIYSQKLKYRVFSIAVVFLCLITGVFTLSRSFVLVATLIFLLDFLRISRRWKTLIRKLFWVTLAVVVSISALNKFPELMDGFEARFTDSSVDTGGGRTTLLMEYLVTFLDSPRMMILGAGVVSYKQATEIYSSIHNALEQILVCYGLVGGIVFLIELVSPLCKLNKKAIKLHFWLPFIGVVLFVQTIQFVNPEMLMMPYAVAIYSLKMGESNKEGPVIASLS